uniref:Uncharacterized protein n=1 Tax=Sphaerodactylus townsendi TaxID=933632 RepID=A0ACB8E683_9SAUR
MPLRNMSPVSKERPNLGFLAFADALLTIPKVLFLSKSTLLRTNAPAHSKQFSKPKATTVAQKWTKCTENLFPFGRSSNGDF